MLRPKHVSSYMCTECEEGEVGEGAGKTERERERDAKRSLPYFDYICLTQVHRVVDYLWPVYGWLG